MVDFYHGPIGSFGKDVHPGPIFSDDGVLQLIALRAVRRGDLTPVDAFLRPDFSRPETGETHTFAAAFWSGQVRFTQSAGGA